jgi:hypothetical protein
VTRHPEVAAKGCGRGGETARAVALRGSALARRAPQGDGQKFHAAFAPRSAMPASVRKIPAVPLSRADGFAHSSPVPASSVCDAIHDACQRPLARPTLSAERKSLLRAGRNECEPYIWSAGWRCWSAHCSGAWMKPGPRASMSAKPAHPMRCSFVPSSFQTRQKSRCACIGSTLSSVRNVAAPWLAGVVSGTAMRMGPASGIAVIGADHSQR